MFNQTWSPYAKALANGFSLAAIADKKEIMGEIGYQKIAHGGAYCGNVVATAAADAVLDEIQAGALEKVDAHGKLLAEGFKNIFDSLGIPAVVQGSPSMCGVLLTEKERIDEFRDWYDSDHGLYEKVIRKCIEKGVMPDIDSREPWILVSGCWMVLNLTVGALLILHYQVSSIPAARDLRSPSTSIIPINATVLLLLLMKR